MSNELVPQRNDDRRDSKWAHPNLVHSWTGGGLAELSNQILKPGAKLEEIISARKRITDLVGQMLAAAASGEEDTKGVWSEYWAPGLQEEAEAPQVRIKVRTPIGHKGEKLPAVFFVFGGGLYLGTPEMFQPDLMLISEKLNCVVIAAEYRLAPENKYPAAVNDLHAGYKWMVENAGELGIDIDRIIVYGESSGGHLAAALMHRLKRFNYINGILPRAQCLIVPIIEDRQFAPSSKIYYADTIWDSIQQHRSWVAWLGEENFASARIGPEAVPGHAQGDDFKGLPPAIIHCMESDPDRDDVFRYTSGLLAGGVYCEFHQWGGTNHMSLVVAGASENRDRFLSLLFSEMQDAFDNDFRRPWLK